MSVKVLRWQPPILRLPLQLSCSSVAPKMRSLQAEPVLLLKTQIVLKICQGFTQSSILTVSQATGKI